MNAALFEYLVPPLWFLGASAILYVLACGYARFLLFLGGRRGATLLWLAFAAIGVAPLFGWFAVARARFPALLEFPALLWPLLCFGLCFAAISRALKPHLRQLQSMGFFLK